MISPHPPQKPTGPAVVRHGADIVPAGAPERMAGPVLRGLRIQPITFTRNEIHAG
ncbi:hypothetical protein [Nocardia sp. CA-120079]|uniref:hypothetical protein n=1 Tax=Nocardia sp. CA-120079 TaxID=3239974 RepID=UPI003D978F58